MTIPFVDLFKKVTEKVTTRFFASAAPGPARVESVRVKKPSGERLSKTVLPNAARSLTPSDPFRVTAGPPSSDPAARQLGPRKIQSAAGPGASRSRDLPPALAFALEPKVERAISLQLADFLDQVPADYIKPVEVIDATRCVALKASEIEKGMPDHKPSISLPSLYQQLPEIFLRSVPLTDPTRISLPYAKVLEQFNKTRVRTDQVRDQRVPQLDNPILKTTLEDTERFGKKIEPPKTSPPHRVISLHATDLQPAPEKDSPPASAKIPFHLPPNGTGAPASERVPASSGPPVPITLPAPPEPARILFNPPAEIVDPKIRSATARNESAPDVDAALGVIAADKPTMGLALKPLLQNVPSFQLSGNATAVAEDVRVEFPLRLIESQLAGGRVVVPAKMFQQAIPEMHRQLFVVDPEETPVSLPLQEVLKNLPATALKMRDDQEKALTGKDFETPFAIKAKEDAERFRVGPGPAPEVSTKSASERQAEAKIDSAPKEKIDGKQVLARACKLPGVDACEIMFSDGLSLAGNFPPEISASGLCAMAPTSVQRIDTHMRESRLGALTAMTLHSTNSAITFFMKESICLAALHSDSAALAPDTRAQLGELVEKLSRTYAQPETPHVDH